jgi:signal transduction histidine kinase
MLIRTRLRIGYLVIFTLALCIGLVMIWAMRGWRAATEDLTYAHAQSLKAERLRGDLYRQIKEILDRLVSGDRSARQEFDALGVALEGSLADLRRHSRTPEEGERVQVLVEAHLQVTSLASEIFDLLATGARDRAVQKVERELEQVAFVRQDDAIDRLRAYYDAASQRSLQRTLAIGSRGELLAGTVMLLALAWGGGLLFGIQQWLVKPLQAIGRSTAIISTGELDHTVQVASRDELGDLAASINRMARSLKEIQERLLQAERVAAAGELSAYIAHNIRNPLASIRSSAQAALNASQVSEEVRIDLTSVIETVDHLGQWVHHFLFALKPITATLTPSDPNRVVEQALDVVRPMIEQKRITIELSATPELPVIPLDERYLEQAFVALLTNACDATPQGGKIRIASRLIREGDGPAGIVIELADNGGGIPAEMLQRLFTPYMTTKRDGVGLGLTMARKIISAHGGSLALSNRPEGGTTVNIHLPLTDHGGADHDGQDSDH